MGLDVIELIMEIEDEFNIEISDEEACQAVTVDKLHQCVLDKIEVSADQRCSTQGAFYLLRKALKENLDIDEKIIKPKTNTELLFPESERRVLWSKMSANVPYKYPELNYPANFFIFVLIIALMTGGICSYFVSQCFRQNNNICLSFIFPCIWIPLAIIFCKLMYKNLLSFKLIIPYGCDTLGGMSKNILYYNGDYFGSLNKKEIWDKLTYIISEQLGVDQNDIKPESNFVEDFI